MNVSGHHSARRLHLTTRSSAKHDSDDDKLAIALLSMMGRTRLPRIDDG